MSQISFDLAIEEQKGVIIPQTLVSPLESTKPLNSIAFKKEQELFKKYVLAVQSYHKCSFIKAREMLISARDKQEPIMVDVEYFF